MQKFTIQQRGIIQIIVSFMEDYLHDSSWEEELEYSSTAHPIFR